MMQTLRKVAVFVLFAILIGAFAISMGGNNYFNRTIRPTVATVGSVEITPEQFRRTYQRVLENLSARAGRRISPQEAQAYGLPERVLQSLIQDAALDLDAKKLGLGLSQAGLKESIYSNTIFQDDKGKFSPEKYQQFLQQIGYSAPAFEQELRGDLVRRQVRSIFEKSAVLPKVMLEAYNRYLNEKRTLSYFTLPAESAGKIETPSDEILKAFYNERRAQFMTPELRKVTVLAIAPESVAKKIEVPESDLKAEYEAHKASYTVPERRAIQLIPFQTPKDAEAASQAIASGKDFLKVGEEAGFKPSDINLGILSKKEFEDKFPTNEAIVNAAFSLQKDQVSKPVDGPLSTVIMRVTEISPAQDKTFDEVKDQIRDSLVRAKAAAETEKLIKAFEDERTAGVGIADSAKKLGLPLEEITLDRTGKGADGMPVKISSVPAATLAQAAFKSDEGVENEALRLPGGGYAWFEVVDIVKARQKAFDEVKADVESAWRKDETRTKLIALAKDLTAKLDHGEAIADVAKSVGADVKTTEPLKRDANDKALPQSAVAQAFALPDGGASSASASDGTSRVVFQVGAVTPPPALDDVTAKSIERQLSNQVSDDNFVEYLTEITSTAGISVDQKNLSTALGASNDAEE
jgi:peptidyl-prolyl cis-trans isomerase D